MFSSYFMIFKQYLCRLTVILKIKKTIIIVYSLGLWTGLALKLMTKTRLVNSFLQVLKIDFKTNFLIYLNCQHVHFFSKVACLYFIALVYFNYSMTMGNTWFSTVIKCSNIIGCERTVAGLWRLGGVKVECFPIIAYENFAQNLKVTEHLIKPNTSYLSKEGLYWMEFDVEHPGK